MIPSKEIKKLHHSSVRTQAAHFPPPNPHIITPRPRILFPQFSMFSHIPRKIYTHDPALVPTKTKTQYRPPPPTLPHPITTSQHPSFAGSLPFPLRSARTLYPALSTLHCPPHSPALIPPCSPCPLRYHPLCFTLRLATYV